MRRRLGMLLLLVILLAACTESSRDGGGAASSSGDSAQATATGVLLTATSPGAAPSATATAASEENSGTLETPPRPGEDSATFTPEPSATPESAEEASQEASSSGSAADIEGALVQVTMPGHVGVLLDEFPADMRDRVAEALMEQPEEEWLARARRQIRLTRLRLNFRDSNYANKGQLPLPQPEQWNIGLDPRGPQRTTVQGHELVMIGYILTTTILSDAGSVAAAEPALAVAGGVWEEPFLFPADPDMLVQRTGEACINDGGIPPNSIDSENAWYFYDFDRTTCRNALAARVGTVNTAVRFQRVAWNDGLADRVRTPAVLESEYADMAVVGDDLRNNRVVYRYFNVGDCALEEGAVLAPGWRRLLQFDANVQNVGGQELHVGAATESGGEHGLFEYAPCHDHVHYRYYGDFVVQNEDQVSSSKQAFCVQSTDRLSNSEWSPLVHDYSCRFQGIEAGWEDEYMAGLDTQWMDITELEMEPEGKTVQLGFVSNEEGFLCEGMPLLDEEGNQLWEPSELTNEEGEPLLRPQCEFLEGWEENNEAFIDVPLTPTGSFVTMPCQNGEVGPLRNCGFSELTLEGVDALCRAERRLELRLRTEGEGAPQVVRLCEWSAVLDTGVACAFEDSLANAIVGEEGGVVSFTCPFVRDAGEAQELPSASYSLYTAPVWPDDGPLPVTASQ